MTTYETDKFGNIVDIFRIPVASKIKHKFWQDLNRIIMWDSETTGFNFNEPDDFRIVQLAAGVYKRPHKDHKGAHEAESFHCWFIKPGIPIPEGAMRVHGIYDSTIDDPEVYEEFGKIDVKDKPTFEEVGPEIRAHLASADIWCAYNGLGFDVNALNCEFKRVGLPELLMPTLDPMVWFLKKKGNIGRKKRGHRLEDLGRSVGAHTLSELKNVSDKQLHDAITDIQLLNDVTWKMASYMDIPDIVDEMVERQAYYLLDHMTEIL